MVDRQDAVIRIALSTPKCSPYIKKRTDASYTSVLLQWLVYRLHLFYSSPTSGFLGTFTYNQIFLDENFNGSIYCSRRYVELISNFLTSILWSLFNEMINC